MSYESMAASGVHLTYSVDARVPKVAWLDPLRIKQVCGPDADRSNACCRHAPVACAVPFIRVRIWLVVGR